MRKAVNAMGDPHYRVTTGADGARYIYFFATSRRVVLCLESDGGATSSLIADGAKPEVHELDPCGASLIETLLTWLAPPTGGTEG